MLCDIAVETHKREFENQNTHTPPRTLIKVKFQTDQSPTRIQLDLFYELTIID